MDVLRLFPHHVIFNEKRFTVLVSIVCLPELYTSSYLSREKPLDVELI